MKLNKKMEHGTVQLHVMRYSQTDMGHKGFFDMLIKRLR